MQFLPSRQGRGIMINITSLIDVMFLLLIFFMVSSTFRDQPAIELTLPRSSVAEDVAVAPTVVYLTRDGRIYLDSEAVEREQLRQNLRRLQAATGEDRIVLRADEHAEHGAVVALIDLIKESGYRRVSLAARPQAAP
ncbi:MAG: biopolymer transporter ExbD [Candidatus Krumholzibacteria bacterium]|nr:biopolymer transporter ExbD [Candidatus Krumholzibacteria bacterium]MDY0108929.1 biopolymer transporter ExbD [Candidatus Krumholzibacteria bacterium]